jgi:hypothetical protein
VTADASFGEQVRAAWRAYTKRAALYQAEVLLNVVYFLVLGPSALASRLFGSHLLDIGERSATSYFVQRPAPDRSLDGQVRLF